MFRYELDRQQRIVRIDGQEAAIGGNLKVDGVDVGLFPKFSVCERDLVRVAAGIHSVDRLAKHSEGVRREISISMHVEDPDRWSAASKYLTTVLWTLTKDRWQIEFRGFSQSKQPLPRAHVSFKEVALFSGGLDSALGLQCRSASATDPIVAVMILGNSRQRDRCKETIEALRKCGSRVEPHVVKHVLANKKYDNVNDSERTRALRFWGMGAAVAHSMGAHTLHTIFRTKGEMCIEVRSVLQELAEHTLSCDAGDHGTPHPFNHCGQCTSCLLRRCAIHAAVGDKDPTRYSKPPKYGPYYVQAFRQHANAIAKSAASYNELLELDPGVRHIEQYAATHSFDNIDPKEATRSMFERYAREALDFLKHLDSLNATRNGRTPQDQVIP